MLVVVVLLSTSSSGIGVLVVVGGVLVAIVSLSLSSGTEPLLGIGVVLLSTSSGEFLQDGLLPSADNVKTIICSY